MPIAPWNPGGYYPFSAANTSPTIPGAGLTNPITGNPMPTSASGGNFGGQVPIIDTTPLSGQIPLQNQAPAGPGGFTNFINSFSPTLPSQQNQGSNVAGQAVGNNLSNAPSLESLTNLINQLNISAQQQANAARIPGATGLEAASSANIGSLLGGNIPQDVQTQLAQSAAERGVGIGSPGSDNVNSSLLRSLGLTSLDLQQLGQQDLTQAYARNPVAKLFDPTTQLITPYQQGELNNQANQLALEWYRTLHPTLGGTGGQRGGGQQPQPTNAPDMSWFQRALQAAGGLNQPVGVAPVGVPPPTTYDPNYPGTSVPGLPPLTSILGLPNQNYGLGYPPISEEDFGLGSPVGYDISNAPTNLGYDQPIDYSNADPFNLYGGG